MPNAKLLMLSVRHAQLQLFRIMLALAMVAGAAAGVQAATASWNANTEPDLAGYKLSYGTQSGVHTVVIDVGQVTTYTFNPPPGKRYYVVVQAYNTAGELSEKSSEVTIDISGTGGPTQPGVPGAPAPTLPPATPGPAIPVPAQPLMLVQPANQTSRVNSNAVLTLSVTNLYGKALTFSATGLPPGLSINSETGVISGTTRSRGFYQVTVTVTDGSLTVGGNFTWSIVDTLPPSANGPNRAPLMDQPENQKTPIDWNVAVVFPASDPEGSALTFTATGLPPGLSINSSSGLVSGTTTTLGSYQVTVTVSDGELLTVRSFIWAVVRMNEITASDKVTGSSSGTAVRASEPDADAGTDRSPVQDHVGVSGDFDGDGRLDLATYSPTSAEWRIWTSGANYVTSTRMVWGSAGDVPLPADYNGDRVTDLGIYRPSTGTWHLWLSGTQTPLAVEWGGAEDKPVALDHDGDGKADLALIRNGGYEILLSSSNYLKSVQVH